MFTTSQARRALGAVSGAALTLSLLAACGAESSADAPATSPEEEATALVEDAKKYAGDPWEQRLLEEREDDAGTYQGDPWEQRVRDRLNERDQ